jgi:hypothetical protein
MASRPQHLAELAGSLEEMTSATRLRAYPSNHNEVPAIPTCTARQEREGVGAAAEFQKLLEHPGIVLNLITAALAHLQIGRAYAMAGDAAKAKSRLGRLPGPLERRRSRHPRPETSQSRVRETAVTRRATIR